MKKLISMVLAMAMLLSAFTVTGYASPENTEMPTETVAETEEQSKIGTEAEYGNTLYYIEDGVLYSSVNSGRPKTVSENATWVIIMDGVLYYSVLGEHNTADIYKMSLSDGTGDVFAHLFVPVEAFDVSENSLYYLYNGEVTKQNLETGEEKVELVDMNISGFYFDEEKCIKAINKKVEDLNNSDLIKLNAYYTTCVESREDIENRLHYLQNNIYTDKANWGNWNGGSFTAGGPYECYGFACQIFYELFHTSPPTRWNTSNATFEVENNYVERICHYEDYTEDNFKELLSKALPGDFFIGSNGESNHAMIVDHVDGEKLYFYDANGQCINLNGSSKRYNYNEISVGLYHNFNDFKRFKPKAFTLYRYKDYPSEQDPYVGTWTLNENHKTAKVNIRNKPEQSGNLIEKKILKKVTVISSEVNSAGNRWLKIVHDWTDDRSCYSTAYIVAKNKSGYDFQDYYTKDNKVETSAQKYNSPNVISSDIVTKSNVGTGIDINITNYPSDGFVAKSFSIGGYIKSNYKITWITAWLKNTTTGETLSYYNSAPERQTCNYSLSGSKVDYAMLFSKCVTPGTYELAVGAANSAGVSDVYCKKYFTVGNINLSQPNISVSSIEEGQKLTITSPDGGTIHYNIDGGYGGEGGSISRDITTPGTHNIYAWVTKSGYNDSPAATKAFTVSKVSTPYISDVTYGSNNAWVTISGSGNINYTTNGSTPTKSSSRYSGTIYLYDSTTIKAMGSQYGMVNSDVASKNITISMPNTPTGLTRYNTKEKIAQGKTATFQWDKMDRATSYTARLYYNGSVVKTYETKGTTASFALPEVGVYTVKVSARNFKGESSECDGVTVESMAPVTVTFVDKILREGKVTDAVVNQIQQNVNDRYGDEAKSIEGNVLSVQKIDYDSKPSIPSWEDRTGFSRQYFSGEAYQNILEDTTVYAYYSVRSYAVQFWDTWPDPTDCDKQIGATQNIMYSFSATAPTEFEMPTGYELGGWNVDSNLSDCYDFTFVEGKMVLRTAFAWENQDMPVILEITGARRDNTCQGYSVDMRYINHNSSDTQARIIMTLYTADGRTVYTATEDVDLMARDPGKYYTETLTADYSEKVSKISAVMVQVKNDRTGGAVSEMVSTEDIQLPDAGTTWTKWSDWSTTSPSSQPNYYNDVKGNERQIDSKIQYRYRNKRYTESGSSSLSGWTKYDTKQTSWSGTYGPVYSNPSGYGRNVWPDTYITSSNYKNVYRYYRIANSEHALWGAAYWAYSYRYNYQFDSPLTLKPGESYSYYLPCNCSTLTSRNDWFHTVYSVDHLGEAYPASVWVSDNYGTRWYYQDPIYTYYYWQWGNWSEWSDSYHSGDETEQRTVYRWRDNFSNYPGYDPSRDNTLEEPTLETYPFEGNIAGLSNDYNGKKATVLVYKKTNTDPTQEQLEYVDQITLGENNSYSFTVNPKEEIDYYHTGDYIVTLSIEGCEKLTDIGIIKAPAPQCIVTFYNDNGTILTDDSGNEIIKSVDKGSSLDVNDIPIPQKNGHRFLKWDTSLINIDSDITVSPIYEKNAYNIVFVDYENETADMVEAYYGDPIPLPEVESVAGKKFIGWDIQSFVYASEGDNIDTEIFNIKGDEPYYKTTDDDYILVSQYDEEIHNIIDETKYYKHFSEANNTVTGSKIVSAIWEDEQYSIKFYDFDGNIVEEQSVAYGESAIPPEPVEKDGQIYSWDLTGDEWWNVTRDMNVVPYIPQAKTVEAPTISVTTDTCGSFNAELESSESEGTIYYTIDDYISDSDAKDFSLMVEEHANEEDEEDEAGQGISLFSTGNGDDNENDEDGIEEQESLISSIKEYTEPIYITPGSIVYAFTIDNEGNISTISTFEYKYDWEIDDAGISANEYVPDSSVQQITMPTIKAMPGETVTVPINIKNNPGLANITLILGFDASAITLDKVENGDVFDTNAFDYEIKADGSCKFVWETENNSTKDGILATLTFTVKENALKEKYLLDLYTDYSANSDNEETYMVTVPGALTDEEQIEVTLGDVNGDGESDFADAILILKYDAGFSQLTENQALVGDVNGDGDVDFSDAIKILKFTAGIINSLL